MAAENESTEDETSVDEDELSEVETSEDEAEEEEKSPLYDEEWLREKYHDESLTQGEIGEIVGTTASNVSHHMSQHGIETRNTTLEDSLLHDRDWMYEAYHGDEIQEGGASMLQIADELGCSDGTVMRYLHEHDIETRPSTHSLAKPNYFKTVLSVEGVGKAKVEVLEEEGFENEMELLDLEIQREDEDEPKGLADFHGWSEGRAEAVMEALEDADFEELYPELFEDDE